MFHRHFDDHIRHGAGGFGRGPFGGWRGRHGGGFERREGRMFDGGELRLVILALVAEKPRYGSSYRSCARQSPGQCMRMSRDPPAAQVR